MILYIFTLYNLLYKCQEKIPYIVWKCNLLNILKKKIRKGDTALKSEKKVSGAEKNVDQKISTALARIRYF